MNEQEIITWYDETKERFLEKYLAEVEAKRNKEKAKAAFSRKFKALHSEYEKRMTDLIKMESIKIRVAPAEQGWKNVVSFFNQIVLLILR